MTLRLATQLGSPEFRDVTDPHPEVWRLGYDQRTGITPSTDQSLVSDVSCSP